MPRSPPSPPVEMRYCLFALTDRVSIFTYTNCTQNAIRDLIAIPYNCVNIVIAFAALSCVVIARFVHVSVAANTALKCVCTFLCCRV